MNKFIIAVGIIIVLVLVIFGIVVLKPQLEKYIEDKQVEAQINVVNIIMQIINEQGYVVLGEGEEQVILIKYVEGESNG